MLLITYNVLRLIYRYLKCFFIVLQKQVQSQKKNIIINAVKPYDKLLMQVHIYYGN